MILKARPAKGSSSEHLRISSSSVPGFTPTTAATSVGAGRKSTTASSIGCTPLFLNAAPHSTGTKVLAESGGATFMPLKSIPVGTIIHNVELRPKKGGQLARAAGTFVQLVGRDIDYALLRLGSGEVRKVHLDCLATIGAVSNPDQQNIVVGKAGRSRWFGIRPHTRGIAKNPVDHPHGGRTKGGKHWVTPWGISTKGKKTRHNKKTDGQILRRRHAAK